MEMFVGTAPPMNEKHPTTLEPYYKNRRGFSKDTNA